MHLLFPGTVRYCERAPAPAQGRWGGGEQGEREGGAEGQGGAGAGPHPPGGHPFQPRPRLARGRQDAGKTGFRLLEAENCLFRITN